MGAITTEEIIEATGGRMICGNSKGWLFPGISIDSRTIREGELFVALRGQKFDGHSFLEEALRKGKGALVSEAPVVTPFERMLILVTDTLTALQDVARYMRLKQPLTVIGITGTNGKTTTKELIASVLSIRHRIMKNSGNLNNEIGLPLSLTRLEPGTEYAVLEMGASRKGDIEQLCGIALPDCGVITNIGPGHLEGFGSFEQVRETKLELSDAVKTLVVNADDEFLMEEVTARKGTRIRDVTTFGFGANADVSARDVVLGERGSTFTIRFADAREVDVSLALNGRINISNSLAAAALSNRIGVSIGEIKEGLESFKGVPMRLEFRMVGGMTIISDVYNANPASMGEAVSELVRLRKQKAIAVLGDMLELGPYAEEMHRQLGKGMAGLPVDVFIAVGPLMAGAAREFSMSGKQSCIAADACEAGRILRDLCKAGDTVLIKGSRGLLMERVLGECPGLSQEEKGGSHAV